MSFGNVLNERQHSRLHEFAAAIAPRRLDEDVRELAQHVVPDKNGHGLENAQRYERGRPRQVNTSRRQAEAYEHKRHEDRLMCQGDQVVIDICFRATGKLADRARQNPVGDLAKYDKHNRNDQRLQIDVRADQFGHLFNSCDYVFQREVDRQSIVGIVFFFVGIRYTERANL